MSVQTLKKKSPAVAASRPFRFKIHNFKELPSTNSYAIKRAGQGGLEGEVFVARFQTSGRGQFERKWVSAPGENLLFSILLRPSVSPQAAPLVTQIVCRSVANVLKESYGIDSKIKRPNDILVNGKKICGILVESSSRNSKAIDYLVIGIGLNVNQAPGGVSPAAIAIKELTGKRVGVKKVLKEILEQLKTDLKGYYASPS